MKKEGALSKIRESEIDNQWFKGAIFFPSLTLRTITTCGQSSQDRPKRVARCMQGGLINIRRFSRICNVSRVSRGEVWP